MCDRDKIFFEKNVEMLQNTKFLEFYEFIILIWM